MSSGPAGWLPIVFTTLGAGVVGSLIATYGGQSRERRKARSEVMACLQRLEIARVTRPAIEGFDYSDKDMAELSARAVLAGVPQYLVSLYQLANEAPRHSGKPRPGRSSVELDFDEAQEMLAFTLADDAAVLVARAVWHPWLSVPFRHRRARKVRDLIIRVFPSESYKGKDMRAFALSEWERANTAWGEWLRAKGQRQEDGGDRSEDKPQHG